MPACTAAAHPYNRIDMAKITIVLAGALTVLGIVGYMGSGGASITALNPAAFGMLFLILGAVAMNPARRKHAMHGAAMLGLIGGLATISGLVKFLRMLGGEEVARPDAVRAQAIMCVLCLVFVALCVKSFIDARRSRAI